MKAVVTDCQCERLLVPSSIALGDAVINPYRGCALGCAYCYVQKNKAAVKRGEPWGSYVDVKVNALEVLERELALCPTKPGRVLMGSTTECYQPCEGRALLARRIIELLNEHRIAVTILTKATLILRDLDVLAANPAPVVYVTIPPYDERFRVLIEPRAPAATERYAVIRGLACAGVRVHAYVNPVLPWSTNPAALIEAVKAYTPYIDFENINRTMASPGALDAWLAQLPACAQATARAIFAAEEAWDAYWQSFRMATEEAARFHGVTTRCFMHPYAAYFGATNYA